MSKSVQSDPSDYVRHAVQEQLLVLDAEFCVKAASKSFYSTFKVGPDETLGRKLTNLGNGQWNIAALLTLLNGMPKPDGEFNDLEMNHDFPALGHRTKLMSARRLVGDGAESGLILLSIRDTTRQKPAETENSTLLARFRTTLASIGDAVIVTDPESRITFMNPTAEKLTGWAHDDALQRPLGDVFNIVNEHASRPVRNPVAMAIRDGAIVGLANHTVLIARDGTEWPIDDSAAPILDAAGLVVGVVLVFHDISNRRKAEHELEISEVRHRRLFESTRDGILILDAATAKVLDVNRFLANLLGYPREHFLGKELWEIGVFKDAESSKTAMATLQKLGEIRFEDLPLQHKDGRHIPVEFVSNVYREGRRSVIQCNIRDITERKGVERALAESQERLLRIIGSATDAIVTVNDEQVVTLFNAAAEQMFRCPADRAIGRPLEQFIPPRFRTTHGEHIRVFSETGVTARAMGEQRPLAALRSDGVEFPVEATISQTMVGGKKLFTAIVRDISERRRAEEALRESEGRLRAIVETAVDGIITIDERGNVSSFNPAAVRLFGYTPHEVIGKNVNQLMPAPYHEEHDGYLHNYVTTGTKKIIGIGREVIGRRKDGSEFPMDLAVSETLLGDRRIFTGIVRDISERKRVDHELANARDAAESANRSKSEFLANMSHEIRTPMNAILGFANMVVHKNQDKAGRIECALTIQRNALHLLELINEILDLSKIEASQMKVERIACNLPEMLSEIVSLMRPRAIEKGLAFGVSFTGPIPRLIQTDPMRLRQILVNLLGNAIKFTNVGKIDARIANEGADGPNIVLRVDVVDTGIGMAPHLLSRLFRPFTQGDESITRKFGGTGLGLTISKRFAELLHGDISVTSEVGIGSTFTLKVDGGPSAGVEKLFDLTEATLPVQPAGKVHQRITLSGRILLVDDGHDNQRLLRMQLGDAGAVVVSAEDGQIAIDLATTQPFDLILMDMQMPLMDGYAATAELRRRGLKTPIIALTAYAMAEDRAKCLASGCDDYLSKPVNEATLFRTINQHLGHDPAPNDGVGGEAVESQPPLRAACDSGAIRSNLANSPRMQTIIPEFVKGLSGEVRTMTDLLARNDLAALQKVVHQLRGASGGYGFDAVTDPAMRAEESIRTGKDLKFITADIKLLIELVRRIEGYDESKSPVAG
jgi:PAS domain S-box-containing protein